MTAHFRRWLVALILLCCFGCIGVRGASVTGPEKLKVVSLFGGRYVSLHQWARVNGYTVDWDKPNKLVHLRSKTSRLSFAVNSKRATINSITIWLCSALAVHREALYLNERDIYKTLHPVLFPEKLAKGRQIRTIVIAAGHGGKDPGNMVNREQEKKYTLLLAKSLREILIANGFKVIMTRDTDVFVDLQPQAAIANRAKADLFISVHYNAVADIGPKGIESFSLTPAGAIATNGGSPSPWSAGNKNDTQNFLLAYQVHKAMLQKTGMEDRGVRRAGFMVLREITMPGILIEAGFMTNPSDAQKIYSASHRKTVAQSIADGILSYKRLVERK